VGATSIRLHGLAFEGGGIWKAIAVFERPGTEYVWFSVVNDGKFKGILEKQCLFWILGGDIVCICLNL
jgi:hypothetical protein